MPKYLLLLHADPTTFVRMSPEEMRKAIQPYAAWTKKLRDKGILLGSHKLRDEPGKVMRGAGAKTRVTDGPYSETKEILGGYYLVEAPNYEAATEIARDCPQLDHGGTIEVREVQELM